MLNTEDSLVLVIDIQEKLVNAVGNYSPVEKARKIIQAADILKVPVIFTEQYPKGLGETVEELKAINSTILEKTSFSALATDEVHKKVKELNKKQIIIFGIETHICVYQTICDLLKEGYEVYFVKDASASRNKYEFKTGCELIKQKGGYVTCCEITLFEWLRSSKHTNFKEIQNLIK